jgi:hypothetical protein
MKDAAACRTLTGRPARGLHLRLSLAGSEPYLPAATPAPGLIGAAQCGCRGGTPGAPSPTVGQAAASAAALSLLPTGIYFTRRRWELQARRPARNPPTPQSCLPPPRRIAGIRNRAERSVSLPSSLHSLPHYPALGKPSPAAARSARAGRFAPAQRRLARLR